MDRYIGGILKNWAAQNPAPPAARTRLFLLASQRNYLLHVPDDMIDKAGSHQVAAEPNHLPAPMPRNLDLVWVINFASPDLRIA
jgi:hypothetical protein